MIRILIADDHAIVRKGIRQILEEMTEAVEVDEAGNGEAALRSVENIRYDIILLDISMPGKSGLEILKQLRAERPEIKVLILSMHPEEQFAVRALKEGAWGYMTKESTPLELITAVRTILKGGRYISSQVAQTLARCLTDGTDKLPHEKLSNREHAVLCMIASGHTVKEIADKMSLSVKTVSTYRARILIKMDMKTNSQLTHYAIQNHLME